MASDTTRDETLTVRLALPDERGALEALQWRASLMWEETREALLAHPDAIQLPAEQIAEGRVFVCERGGSVVGFAVVVPREDGDAELDGLFVEPVAWRSGAGTRLVAEAERLAVRWGASILHVIANKRALDFYRARDFHIVGQAQTRFGPAIAMEKELRG